MAEVITGTTPVPASVSGQGAGIRETKVSLKGDVKVSFTDQGEVVVTGNYALSTSGSVADYQYSLLSNKVLKDAMSSKPKLHWTDLATLVAILKTEYVRAANVPLQYKAGRRNLDELDLVMIIKEIEASEGKKDWNTIIRAKEKVAPDDTKQEDSPANPASPYYSPNKPVFAYDPDNGYIIYQSGEIIWTRTRQTYVGSSHGGVKSYDKANGLITFMNGAVLNLRTMELTMPGTAEAVSVKTVDPWYKIYLQKLMSDRKTQLITFGILGFLLLLKKRRNDRAK